MAEITSIETNKSGSRIQLEAHGKQLEVLALHADKVGRAEVISRHETHRKVIAEDHPLYHLALKTCVALLAERQGEA